MDEELKQCSECLELQKIVNFCTYKLNNGEIKRTSKCNKCRGQNNNIYFLNNPEKFKVFKERKNKKRKKFDQEYYKNLFFKKCKEKHKNKYNYSKSDYKGYRHDILIICPIHGEFKQKAKYHLNSGCVFCFYSKGEKEVQQFLFKNNIVFEKEKTFNKLHFFDFYIPNYNLCVEYDGIQHFEPVDIFGGEEKYKKTQESDQIKNQFCKDNNINLIRIPYWDFDKIEQILKEYFKK